MSNTTFETQVFIPLANALQDKAPKLTLVDGAQGGRGIDIINDTADAFWNNVNARLQQAGLTPAQVQAVWFKQAEIGPSDTSFATYPDALEAKFRVAMHILKAKFPNVKLCYLSSRIYAGYARSNLNPEPYAWYSGWSVKRLIEDQINGDTSLAYAGPNARAPWLSWGPYLWADGTTPRIDGLTWICPTDYNSDGTHPAASGRQKVADLLLQFFTTDATSTPWFLKQTPTSVLEGFSNEARMQLYPVPARNTLTIAFSQQKAIQGYQTVVVRDITGRAVKQTVVAPGLSFNIDISALMPGMYLLEIGNLKSYFSKE